MKLIACEKPPKPEQPNTPHGPITIAQLLVAFLKHTQSYYIDWQGEPSREYGHYLDVARLLRAEWS